MIRKKYIFDNSRNQLKCKIFYIDYTDSGTERINDWFLENKITIISFDIIPCGSGSRIIYHYYEVK